MRGFLLATVTLCAVASTPAQAAASSGYNVLTSNQSVTVSQDSRPLSFSGVNPGGAIVWNGDGSMAGNSGVYKPQLPTAIRRSQGIAFVGAGYPEATLAFTGPGGRGSNWPSFYKGNHMANPNMGVSSRLELHATGLDDAPVQATGFDMNPFVVSPDILPVNACAAEVPNTAYAGRFGVHNGKIYGPNGTPFIARGINVGMENMGDAMKMLANFPGLNLIRLAVGSGANPASLPPPAKMASFIQTMTAHGVVVVIEDHPWGSGSSPQPNPYTGQELAAESNWYAHVASYYKDNPYVWFGTMNEPESGDRGIMQAQVNATYSVIRGTGNLNPIMIEAGVGGGNAQTVGDGGGYSGPGSGYTARYFAGMTNIIWDLHFYNWVKYSPDMNSVLSTLYGSAASHSGVAALDTITSADGQIPIIIGETGISISNNVTGGLQIIQAAFNNPWTSGAVAWAWYPQSGTGDAELAANDDLTDGHGNLSGYGRQIAAAIATSAARECPVQPHSPHPQHD